MEENNHITRFKELVKEKKYKEAELVLKEIKKNYNIKGIDFYEALLKIELGKRKEAIALLKKEANKGNIEAKEVLEKLERKPIGTLAIISLFIISFIIINKGNNLSFTDLLKYGFYKGASLYNLFTSLFTHYSVLHLVFNSLGLLFFGSLLEKETGTKRMLIIFILSGLLGNYIQVLIPNVIVIGASGGIFGIIGSFLIIDPFKEVYLFNILPIRSIVIFVIYFIVTSFIQSEKISEISHFIGFVTGQIISVIMFYKYRNSFYLWTSIYIGLWNIIYSIRILKPISLFYFSVGAILLYFGWDYFREESKSIE